MHLWKRPEHEKAALPIPGRRDEDRWGTPETALRLMDRSGIAKLVFLNFLPSVEMMEARLRKLPADLPAEDRATAVADLEQEMVERVRRQNAWACEVGATHDRLVPLIGVQKLVGPDVGVEELRLGHKRGAKGVKIQPGMNQYSPTDRAMWPIYDAARELGLPITSDTGTYGRAAPDGRPFGQPINFREILENFPGLTFVMAHFASAYWDERIELALEFPDLCFDLSGGFGAPDVVARDDHRALPEEDAVRVLRKVGVERFMFGTDGPSVMPQPYIEQTLRLGLSDDEEHLILADNAKRIYRL